MQINEAAKKTQVFGKFDVIVAGGGLGGAAAAAGAAKAGASVLLVEDNSCLGGTATAGLETSFCNFLRNEKGEIVQKGPALDFIQRLVRLGAAPEDWGDHKIHVLYDVESGKVALDAMLEEAGVQVLLQTRVADVIMEDNRVKGLIIENKSGRQAVLAGNVVDATGDAQIASQAGSRTISSGDNYRQGHSFLFRLGNVDTEKIWRYLEDHPEEYITETDLNVTFEEIRQLWVKTGRVFFMHFGAKKMRLIQDAIARGEYTEKWGPFQHMDAFQLHGIKDTNTMIVNTGFANLDETNAEKISYLLKEGRKMARHVASFLKKYFPGCENSFVAATAEYMGLRMIRWIEGDFVLNAQHVYDAAEFEDAVGLCPVNLGVTENNRGSKRHQVTNEIYEIPLRCMLPKGIEGLVMGSGRSTSCNPPNVLRPMPQTMAVGNGAGIAAAVAAKDGVPVRKADMDKVAQVLASQGTMTSRLKRP